VNKKYIFILATAFLLTGCGTDIAEENSIAGSPSVTDVTAEQTSEKIEESEILQETTEIVTEETTSVTVTETVSTQDTLITSTETTAIGVTTTTVTEETNTEKISEETVTEEVTVEVTEEEPLTEEITEENIQNNIQAYSGKDVIEGYKSAVTEKFNSVLSDDYYSTVEYTLYDMDYDGIPELIIKYGTCEADYRISVFTYNESGLREIADNISGSHTSFGYDYVADQLVILQGQMGYGDMSWYDIDESGNIRFLISTGGFEYGADADNDFDAYMKKYNVARLSSVFYSTFGKTYVSSYINGKYNSVEYEGFDFSFLEENISD